MENRMKDQGMIAWLEIITENIEETVSFYKNVFGYTREDMQMPESGTYTLLKMPNHVHAVIGLFKPTGKATDVSKFYFTVDNVDETEKKALALGGSIVQSAFDMAPMCRMAILKDDNNYLFGVVSFFEDAMKGFDPAVDNAGRTQGIVGWFDILSQDVDKALSFYTGLFGYKPDETPDAPQRYVVLRSEHAKNFGFGAVTQMPEAAPKSLGTRYIKKYISVDDLEKTNEAVKANGGTILAEKIDVPPGAFSIFTDNNGSVLSAIHYIK